MMVEASTPPPTEQDEREERPPSQVEVETLLQPRPIPTSAMPSRRDCLELSAVVGLAFIGIAFYFLARPHGGTLSPHSPHPPIPSHQPRAGRRSVAPTILISIDGFRHDYWQRRKNPTDPVSPLLAPNLHAIATHGVYAENGMQPVMPSKTIPNHWSLVTGLYPENSGIVGNTMYDPVRKKWFHQTSKDPEWWSGEPIWQTLRRTPRVSYDANGTKTRLAENYTTATVFWPGSYVKKHAPDVFLAFNRSMSYEERVTRAVSLLKGNATDLNRPAQFVTLYFGLIDRAGHKYGPDSPEVNEQIERVDKAIGFLLSSLGSNVSQSYNIVVVSDHGMTNVSSDRTIDLKPCISERTAQDVTVSPLGLFLNVSVSAEELYKNITKCLVRHEQHASVYMKQNIPESWRLRGSRLIPRIVTIAKLGWTVLYPHQVLVPGADDPLERGLVLTSHAGKVKAGEAPAVKEKGQHGFETTFPDMHAVFLARGPAFKAGVTMKKMRNVDVYEMLCYIFSASPAPNDGTLRTTTASILQGTSASNG